MEQVMPVPAPRMRPFLMWRCLPTFLCAMILYATLLCASNAGLPPARAVEPQARPRPLQLATVDFERLLEEHPLLAPLTDILKRELEFDEEKLEKRRKKLEQHRKELQQLDKESREYRRLETDLQVATTQWQAECQQMQQVLLQRQADIRKKIMEDVAGEIDGFCRRHKIGLLLRRSPGEADEDDLDRMLLCLQRSVLYDNGLDVTDEILAAIQTRYQDHQPP